MEYKYGPDRYWSNTKKKNWREFIFDFIVLGLVGVCVWLVFEILMIIISYPSIFVSVFN